eukprot:s1276_g7.t1
MKSPMVFCFLLLLVFGLGACCNVVQLSFDRGVDGASLVVSVFLPIDVATVPWNSRADTPYHVSFWYDPAYASDRDSKPTPPDWVGEWSAYVYDDESDARAKPDLDAVHEPNDSAETSMQRRLQLPRVRASNMSPDRGVGSQVTLAYSVVQVLLSMLGRLLTICRTVIPLCPSLVVMCILAFPVPVAGNAQTASAASPNPQERPHLNTITGFIKGLGHSQGLAVLAFSMILVAWGAAIVHMIPGNAVPRMPPAWSPDMSHRYPFRHWAQDVLTWSIAAEGDPSRKAALLTMSLKGTAYEFCRTIPPMTLVHGGAINGHHVDPLTYIMHALAERFADLGEELRLTSITDLFNFGRQGNERIDELITRFDLIRQRSYDLGQLTMSVTGLAYILLKACEVSDTQLIQLLAPLQGRFPNDDQEFQILKTQLRRMGHILEHSPGNIAAALRGRNAQPQYLATKDDAPNADVQSAYVAYGDTGYGRGEGTDTGWGYGGDNHAIPGSHNGQDAHQAFLAELESDGATDSDTASSTGMTEVPTSTPEGWTDDASLQEHLFWAYSRAKATWRKFMGRLQRSVRRFTRRYISRQSGKGKGKRWTKGRPNVTSFLASLSDDEAEQIFAGFKARRAKGKGKGKRTSGKGKGRSQNPFGKDGQRMRCFRCGSETHLSAYTNLAGLRWVRQLAQKCHDRGLDVVQHQLSSPMSIAGVGQGTQQCTWAVRLPIGVPAVCEGEERNARCSFEAPVVGGSGAGLPALLGLRSLRSKNAILVLSERDEDLKLIIPGPGGWEYQLSPGSVEHPLTTAPSGHLLLRCDLYEGQKVTSLNRPGEAFMAGQSAKVTSSKEMPPEVFAHGLAHDGREDSTSASSSSSGPRPILSETIHLSKTGATRCRHSASREQSKE